ncbi:MAG: hypothetical protein SOH99_08135 [Acidipropionibacterium acidipropionici]|uniref:hypothetical protein n=1 Tax=Acidipropionibacterium acidipropionici TaxID=1748 RepID=UPI002F356883
MSPTTSPPESARVTTLRLAGAGSAVDLEIGTMASGLVGPLTRAWRRCLRPSPQEGTPTDSPAPAASTVRIDLTAEPDPSLAASSPDPDALMTATTQAVTHALITAGTGAHLMFHAGALAHPRTNDAVVLVAPGGTGKTTLTRTLGTRYRYLTDETVVVDTQGRALPYPKPLSIRTPSRAHKVETPPDELSLLPDAGPAQVARILILDRSEHHAAPHIEEMDLFDAVMELAPQTSALSALDAGLHRLADLIGATGPVLTVRYRDAQTLAPLVADLIGEA